MVLQLPCSSLGWLVERNEYQADALPLILVPYLVVEELLWCPADKLQIGKHQGISACMGMVATMLNNLLGDETTPQY